MRKAFLQGFILCLLAITVSCGNEESEEERIVKEFDTFSVHLYAGLKLILANPENDPEIAIAKTSFQEILNSNLESGAGSTIGLVDMARLAKLGYKAKGFGETEIALGRENKKLFILERKNDDKNPKNITPANDHAIILAMLFAAKLSPGAPIPISDNAMLYEAWMAEGLHTSDKNLNGILMSVQAVTYAENGYCEMGDAKTAELQNIEIKKLDPMALAFAVSIANVSPQAAAHIGKENIIAMFLPQILEVLPGAARTYAHFQLSNCFNERSETTKALAHQEHAIDAISKFGVPDSELAILKAGVAYRAKDYKQTSLHLKKAHESAILDDRTKADLKQLAEELDNEESDLVKKYFSSAYFGFTIAKIVNNRLLDEGVYDELLNHHQLKTFLQMYEGILKIDKSNVFQNGYRLSG